MLESPITFNNLVLNDQSKRDYTVAPYYWFKVNSIDGLWDQDVRFETHDLPHRHGASSGDAFYTGKTIVLSGQVRAKDLTLLREAQRALQAAFYDMQDYPLTFTLWGETQVYITCRKNQKIDMPEVQDTAHFWRNFTIQLWADDPHMYIAGSTTVYSVTS